MDSSILNSNIFFIVTTAVVLFIGLLVGLALVYLLFIMHNIKNITRDIKKGAVLFASSMDEVKSHLEKETLTFVTLVKLLIKPFLASRKKSTKSKE